jgi:hypothetical protein
MSTSDSVLDDILAAAESLTVADTPPPRSPGVSFPLIGRVSTRGGGVRIPKGTAPAKLFPVLDIDCADLSYCFGVIGNHGVAFCIKRNCYVKSNSSSSKMSFAGIEESFVFIRENLSGSVLSEPNVSSSKIPIHVMSKWESQSLSITDWAKEFQAVDGTVEVLTSAEEIQTDAEFLVESLIMRTPGKRKETSFSGD